GAGGRIVVRDPVVRVAGGTAGAGRLRPLPELGADLACDGAAAGGPGRPAAVAAAGGGVRAGRLAVRPPDRTARVGRPCAEPGRHLPGQPEGAFAAARTAGLTLRVRRRSPAAAGSAPPDAVGRGHAPRRLLISGSRADFGTRDSPPRRWRVEDQNLVRLTVALIVMYGKFGFELILYSSHMNVKK